MGFLETTGLVFWIVLGLGILFTGIFVQHESIFAIAPLILMLGVLHYGLNYPIPEFLPKTWKGWVLLVGGFLLIGVCWSFFKFYIEFSQAMSVLKIRFERGDFEHFAEISTWEDAVRKRGPRVSEFKEQISVWILFWPISMFIYLVGDILLNIGNFLYSAFSGVYEYIADWIVSKYK